jgi:UDP-N-acetylglucosamine 2-epimerase (non-hydrolysing)
MTLPHLHLIAAARPNFMKVAPLYRRLRGDGWCQPILVHTGQHYDAEMSDAFFRDLELPPPDHHLGVGSGSHAEQTGAVMIAYERLCGSAPPDFTVVVGDVNSTMAATIAAKKLCLPVAHLEAGLRSFDRTMPEEINRLVTDALADILWTPSQDGTDNLLREGVAAERIELVGNIMIDCLEMMRPQIDAARARRKMSDVAKSYAVVTLHRPANVDHPDSLERAVAAIEQLARRFEVVFPVHPRTRERLGRFGLLRRLEACAGVRLMSPIGYIDFMSLVFDATLVITDSGGVQEETTYLGIPCVTLRPNTERPITVSEGTNRLAGLHELDQAIDVALSRRQMAYHPPRFWDGHTAGRVSDSLRRRMGR